MELLTSVPPELALLAEPSARGAAPLLRSPAGASVPSPGAAAFADFLALLTTPLASGESWPAPGNDLPVLPLAADDELDPAVVPLVTLPPLLPTASLANLERQALLGSAEAWVAAPSSEEPAAALAAGPGFATEVFPSGELPPADALAPQPLLELEPSPATVLTGDAEALPPLGDAESAPSGPAGRASPPPSWLEALGSAERGLQMQKAAAATGEGLAATSPTQPGAGAPADALLRNAAGAAAPQPPPATASMLAQRSESAAVAAVVAPADGASATSVDWLPPPGTHAGSAAPSAAAPPPVAAGPPVDTRTPNWHEAFASRVQWAVDTQVGEARIKLSPPELGAVDVKISLVEDKTYVQLTTATAAARDELAQSLPRLRELFTVSGLELGGASVHDGRDQHRTGRGRDADAAAHSRPLTAFAPGTDEPPAGLPRRAAGRIDTFA